MPATLHTEDTKEYTFYPVKHHRLVFSVKACHNAHVALASETGDPLPIVEIFLGGWDNSKSAIRFNKEKPDQSEAPTPSICNGDEFRTFVLEWTCEGLIQVFMESASEPFLTWKNEQPFPVNYFGIRTAWGATGEWKIDGTKEIQTEDSKEYQWFPVHSAQIHFDVKAKNDAHIALTSGPAANNPMYEVFLGGWSNSKCAIRVNQEKPDVCEAEGSVDGENFLKFWIKLSYAGIHVGRGGEAEPFMSWQNPEPILISHFGIRTSYGSDGDWQFKDIGEDTPQVEPTEDGEPDAKPPDAPPAPEGLKWVAATGGEIPENAIIGGEDNGKPLYVVRAQHEDSLIPGKLLTEHGVAYIPYGGEEHAKEAYEVLVADENEIEWVDGAGDTVPENAVPGGSDGDDSLYIGRATHEGFLTVGKFHPAHECVYISYGGSEISYPDFQILVKK